MGVFEKICIPIPEFEQANKKMGRSKIKGIFEGLCLSSCEPQENRANLSV